MLLALWLFYVISPDLCFRYVKMPFNQACKFKLVVITRAIWLLNQHHEFRVIVYLVMQIGRYKGWMKLTQISCGLICSVTETVFLRCHLSLRQYSASLLFINQRKKFNYFEKRGREKGKGEGLGWVSWERRCDPKVRVSKGYKRNYNAFYSNLK